MRVLVPLFAAWVAASPLYAQDAKLPRLVAAWPEGLMGVRMTFDGRMEGRVEAAPKSYPNAVEIEDRATVRIAASRWEDDGRTLVLATDPHPFRHPYEFELIPKGNAGATIAVPYQYLGAAVAFRPDGGEETSLWWPSLNSGANRAALRGSSSHERLESRLEKRGELGVRTTLAFPKGRWELQIASSGKIVEPVLGIEDGTVENTDSSSRATFAVEATGDPLDLSFRVATGAKPGPFRLDATVREASGGTSRPLPAAWMAMPDSPPVAAPAVPPPNPPDAIRGGNARQGETVFFSEAAKCGTCHARGGRGGAVGPDLTDVGRRGLARVYRDIQEPSAVIRPDFVTYTVTTRDGRVLAGIVRAEGADAAKVVAADGQAVVVPKAEIEELRSSATSLMPVGLPGAIGEAGMRDLMAYLMAK